MKLSIKQQRFVDEYIISGNATEAAIKAGYSPKTATVIGCENLMKPYIKETIENMLNKAKNERIADANEILEYLTQTMRDDGEQRRERTKAADLLGRRFALFAEQPKDMDTSNRINLSINIKNCGGNDNGK